MINKIDTSPEALRAHALVCEENGWTVVLILLRALADEKKAWTAREVELERERDEARAELAKANNEFGSETHDWPELWKRIADVKQYSGEQWRRAEQAKADAAAMRDALHWYAGDGDGSRFQIVDDRGEVITNFSEFNSRARHALATTTAGRDLMARMVGLQEAVRLADRLIPWGAAKGEWRELKEVERALSVQCP